MKKSMLLVSVLLLVLLAGCGKLSSGSKYNYDSVEALCKSPGYDTEVGKYLSSIEDNPDAKFDIIPGYDTLEFKTQFKHQITTKPAEVTYCHDLLRDEYAKIIPSFDDMAKNIFKEVNISSLTVIITVLDADGTELYSSSDTYFR